MTALAPSIVSKLTAEELTWLTSILGADLRNPESTVALFELEHALNECRRAFERHGGSTDEAAGMACSFCGTPPPAVGPVYSGEGIAICTVCTASAVRSFAAGQRSSDAMGTAT